MSVDQKAIAVYNEKAADYAARFDTNAKPGAHLRRFIEALPSGGDVLDLGCGTGGASRHMMAAGLNVDAMDASAEMIRVAAKVNGVTARQGTFDDLDAVDAYDGVWANFSLLHAPREKLPLHLAAIVRALRAGGVFHIGMKTGAGTTRDHLERKYTFVSETELRDLLTDAGLEIVAQDVGHEVGLAGTDDWWIVVMAVKPSA